MLHAQNRLLFLFLVPALVMLLIFTPCLYCDVSDAWRFPEKRRRIFVAAAGMYFE